MDILNKNKNTPKSGLRKSGDLSSPSSASTESLADVAVSISVTQRENIKSEGKDSFIYRDCSSRKKGNKEMAHCHPVSRHANWTPPKLLPEGITVRNLLNWPSDKRSYFFDIDRRYFYIISRDYLPFWKIKLINEKGRYLTVGSRTIGIFGKASRDYSNRLLKTVLGQVAPNVLDGEVLSLLSNLMGIIQKVFSFLSTARDAVVDPHFKPLVLDIMSLLLQGSSTSTTAWSPFLILGHLLRFYSIYTRTKILLTGESFEAIVLAALTLGMPHQLIEIIKRINLFTGKKILDNPSSIFDMIGYVIEFFVTTLKLLPLPLFVVEILDNLSLFTLRRKYLENMHSLLIAHERNRTVMLDEQWRLQVKELGEAISNCDQILNFFKQSPSNLAKYNSFCRLVKSLQSYENCSRKEPLSIVFEGPPGVMKSFRMNQLVTCMDKSVYTHVVKSTQDGKDFYDGYNNEEIFVMDDVGQQGISQWRNIINMVSSVKMPLECAAVDLKDTKYFNSDYIFCTTNNFLTISGVTKSDCISDIKALWRRCYVFDFNQVKNVNGQLEGDIVFKRYNVATNKIESTFPCSLTYPTKCDASNVHRTVGWMKAIVVALRNFFDANYTSSIMNVEDKALVNRYALDFVNGTDLDTNTQPVPSTERFYSTINSSSSSTPVNKSILLQPEYLIYSQIPKSFVKFVFSFSIAFLTYIIQYNLVRLGEFVLKEKVEAFANHGTDFFRNNPHMYACLLFAINVLVSYIIFTLIYQFVFTAKDSLCESFKGIFPPAEESETLFGLFGQMENLISVNNPCVEEEIVNEWRSSFQKLTNCKIGQSLDNVPTMVTAIQSRMAVIEIPLKVGDIDGARYCQCLMSGHNIIIVGHTYFKGANIVNVYRDWTSFKNRSPMLNNIPVNVVYDNINADIIILQTPLASVTPFKSCKQFFKVHERKLVSRQPYAVCSSALGLLDRNLTTEQDHIQYKTAKGVFEMGGNTHIDYSLTGPGLCGTLLVDPNIGIIGMHVAGDGTIGTAIVFSKSIIEDISNILGKDRHIHEKEIQPVDDIEFSGLQVDNELYHHVPGKTSLRPSPLHGMVIPTKHPANLSAFGPKTVEKMAKKSFKKIPVIPSEELSYAEDCLRTIIPLFEDVSDFEIVKGSEFMAGLNKESVNGFGLEKEKEYYIDFEKGEIRPNMIEIMEQFRKDIIEGKVRIEDVLYYETLKDELRREAKVDKPRSFRVCRLPIILWTKRLLGDLFRKTVRNRNFNQIAIGVNPYTEWQRLYDKITSCDEVFDGDIGSFDGKQAAQIQDLVNRLVKERYRGNYPEVLEFILEQVVRSWVLVRNKLFQTSHSMPSGSWVTGLFNSYYNRCYSACTLKRQATLRHMKSSVSWFHEIMDEVCGDDKLCGAKGTLTELFNALTVKEFFNSIGMDFTDGAKGEITQKSKSVSELSFLKRSFRYHPELRRVMGPLSKETLENSVMWLDSKKDMEEVMFGKLSSFQREMYLHEDGEKYVDNIEKECRNRGISFKRLSREYLKYIFENEPEEAYNQYLQDNGKNFDIYNN